MAKNPETIDDPKHLAEDRNILLEVQHLSVEFRVNRKKTIQAVSDISLKIEKGQTVGLVGESGCGKSSLVRAIMQLLPYTSGRVFLNGRNLTGLTKQELRQLRPDFQIVFQDSISALNPRRKIGDTIAMPLRIATDKTESEIKQRVTEMMLLVGLDPDNVDRRPFELSGGQCQRVQIARALMTEPKLLICDEPVSSLDVSVQAQIINLLEHLRRRYGLTMLFISHDLVVVKNVCDRVAVMYLGKLCEIAPSESLYHFPAHPYTKALLNTVPRPDPSASPANEILLAKEMPSPADPLPGCRFQNRCPEAMAICAKYEPVLKTVGDDCQVACHLA